MNDRFEAKRWVCIAQASVFTPLGVMTLILGAAMLSGRMRDARGESVTAGGWPCLLAGAAMTGVGAFAWYQALALRTPPIRLCSQGVAVTIAGATSLDDLPPILGLARLMRCVRAVWGVATGQIFRSRVYVAPWESVHDAFVSGPPGMGRLTILAEFSAVGGDAGSSERVMFPQHLFRDSLEEIADAVLTTAADPALRRGLPPLEVGPTETPRGERRRRRPAHRPNG